MKFQSFRDRRQRLFQQLIAHLPRPLRILDVGGSERFWRQHGLMDGCAITLLNLRPMRPKSPNMTAVVCDACDMSLFYDGEFDLVFSNSCIEHVGDWSRQQQFAAEVRRVGRGYFVQTPFRHFPLEPHFYMPFFQYWPRRVQEQWVRLRFRGARRAEMQMELGRIRLLTAKEMNVLYPDGALWRERIGPLTKSLVAYYIPT